MRDICYKIVSALGDNWNYLGWVLFLAYLILPMFGAQSPLLVPVVVILTALLAGWWLIDLVDNTVPLWKVVVGLVMIGIGFLPQGGLLFIAAWVIYWMKVRE